jgi:AcrR family transcriptional regulator
MKEFKYCSKKRTHEKIKKAFAEMLAEKKALNKITVAELAERAEVTRGTFYAHYNNIFEVAEELENDFISVLDSSAEKMSCVEDFPIYFHQVFVFLAEHEELYCQLLQSDAPLVFVSRLNHQIEKTIKEILREHSIDKPMLDLDIAFFTDGATYMILKYFRKEISLNLDEIEWYLKQRIFEMFLKDL